MGNSDDHQREMEWQGRLVDWQKRYETVMHYDRITADLGIFVLKTTIVINGAALVALLAAYPGIRGDEAFAAAIPAGGYWFLWGLLLAVLAAFIAYFSQGFMAAMHGYRMQKEYGNEKPPNSWAEHVATPTVWVAILLVGASYVMFALGGHKLLGAFSGTV